MPYLSSYKLEEVCDKKGKLFIFLEGLSLIMKLAAILLLILLWRYFYIAIAVWALSMVAAFFKRDLIYKYVYVIDNGVLKVIKMYNAEKSITVQEIVIDKDISDITFSETEKKYYERTVEMPITIVLKSGEEFSLSADTYFYGLLDYYRRQDGLFR